VPIELLQHPVNHVLVQLYRTGAGYISEHSNKMIDVVCDTRIVNLSHGATHCVAVIEPLLLDHSGTMYAKGKVWESSSCALGYFNITRPKAKLISL
jgi:hypothetical protein